MTTTHYSRFFPLHYRYQGSPPVSAQSTWWDWRGRSVHIRRTTNPQAPVRVLGIHGAGGYSGALWPFAELAAGEGGDVMFPDLPLYGDTLDPRPGRVRYQTWIDLLCDLVVAERQADERPLVLFGGSMGGMLAYEVAARTRDVAAVVATCLLDPSRADARRAAARFAWTGPIAPGLLRALSRVAGDVRVPVRWLVDMQQMSANPLLVRQCATDPKGGGASVPLGLLASYFNFRHTPPETFDAAPVTLVHPARDQWTPAELSIQFLERITGEAELVLLDRCGHFPVEEPGLTQLVETMNSVRAQAAAGTR